MMKHVRWFIAAAILLASLAGCSATLVVENSSTHTVDNLRVYPTGTFEYGANRLGSDTLAPDHSFTVTGIAGGTYDFFASDPIDGYWEKLIVTLSPGETHTWTLLDDDYTP
jgi:hypothetical protein